VGAVSIAGVDDDVLGVDTSIGQQLRRVSLNTEASAKRGENRG
jgi:hypothetical protein